jgi:hypothetical protein
MKAGYEVDTAYHVPIPMQDGVRLYADIYTPRSGQKFPVLLMRTPYDKSYAQHVVFQHPEWLASHGFIVVVQDVRGRYRSEGTFTPFHQEAQDGADTIAWLHRLPQSNGKIGMYGFSYVGAVQLLAAAKHPHGLMAMAPAFTNDGFYEDWCYKNGALHLAFLVSWSAMLAIGEAARQGRLREVNSLTVQFNHIDDAYGHLPLTDHPQLDRSLVPFFYEWLAHPCFDDYWKTVDLGRLTPSIQVPALHIGGWYDVFIEGTIRNYTAMRNGQNGERHKLVIGPWSHGPWTRMVGTLDFGEEADNFINGLLVRWFRYWLKGENTGIAEEPPVSIFVMGANRWRQSDTWPLANTVYTNFYLHSDGNANSLGGDGTLSTIEPEWEPPDIYIYHPGEAVPSIGGHSCCMAEIAPMGPKDQRLVEMRNDVLVYTSAELTADMEVTGPVEAVIYASSSAEDTDFTVKLVDVHPDGKAINLIEGIQRASYRASNEHPSPIEPFQIYEYRFQVGSTSNLFKKGHRIRVEVSSSNFPAFDRHLNVYRPERDWTYADAVVATQKIYHNHRYPSRIVLPIIPN